MVDLAEAFRKYLNIEPTLKRMDSLMVASGSKKMSRLEILYTCVTNVVKQLHKNGETTLVQPLQAYLKEEHRNQIIYHQRHEDLDQRLSVVIQDAKHLMNLVPENSQQTEAYHHLVRVMEEQTHTDNTGTIIAKPKKDISSQSMQNPSDPDATFRFKSGQNHKGYVAHVVETTGKEGSMITAYDYQPNIHSDNEFCRKTIEEMGPQEEKTTLVADGAYASTENTLMAEANNIDLVITSLLGKAPDEVQANFKLDTKNHKVLECPAGKKPYKTRYYQKTGIYRASFTLNLPGLSVTKSLWHETPKEIQLRDDHRKNGSTGRISTEVFSAEIRQNRFLPDILTKLQGFWETMCSNQHFIRLWA